jgi:aspartate/methionine/tyrosine aminotransferase
MNLEWFHEMNDVYEARRKLIWKLADLLHCTYDTNSSGLFVWAKLPDKQDSETFIDKLLYKENIFVAPGSIFGSSGEGYIRFSLCVSLNKIEEALKRIQKSNPL